jgi:hypothetical protein
MFLLDDISKAKYDIKITSDISGADSGFQVRGGASN